MTASARIIPFPVLRRKLFVECQQECFALLPPQDAEKNLRATLRRQRGAMERAGVDPAIIARELSVLECAIRSGSAWVNFPGGGA
jgi:hypothetical protein